MRRLQIADCRLQIARRRAALLRRGFTIIELMTVICIIAILAAILLPVFARSREQARKSSCQANLMQIGMALHLYAQDNQGRFPPEDFRMRPLLAYTKNAGIFQCPSGMYPLMVEPDPDQPPYEPPHPPMLMPGQPGGGPSMPLPPSNGPSTGQAGSPEPRVVLAADTSPEPPRVALSSGDDSGGAPAGPRASGAGGNAPPMSGPPEWTPPPPKSTVPKEYMPLVGSGTQTDGRFTVSYAYRGGLTSDDPGTTPICGDRKASVHLEARNVLRIDGSVKCVPYDPLKWQPIVPDRKPVPAPRVVGDDEERPGGNMPSFGPAGMPGGNGPGGNGP